MMKRTRRRCLHELLALGGAAVLPGCATIIHPERQGNNRGRIDVGPLILDILWFIPGLIPGIIALAVDFGTGAIYLGGRTSTASCEGGPTPADDHEHAGPWGIVRGERITVRAPELEAEVAVVLRLLGPRGTVLDETRGRWSPTRREPLTVAFRSRRDDDLGEGRLQLEVRRGPATQTAEHPLLLTSEHGTT